VAIITREIRLKIQWSDLKQVSDRNIHVHTWCATINGHRVTSYLAGFSAVVLLVTSYSMNRLYLHASLYVTINIRNVDSVTKFEPKELNDKNYTSRFRVLWK